MPISPCATITLQKDGRPAAGDEARLEPLQALDLIPIQPLDELQIGSPDKRVRGGFLEACTLQGDAQACKAVES